MNKQDLMLPKRIHEGTSEKLKPLQVLTSFKRLVNKSLQSLKLTNKQELSKNTVEGGGDPTVGSVSPLKSQGSVIESPLLERHSHMV